MANRWIGDWLVTPPDKQDLEPADGWPRPPAPSPTYRPPRIQTTSEFRCVLADPPWPEYGGGRRGAQNHYGLLSVPEIAKVMLRSEVWSQVSRDAHLWLWAPSRIWMALRVVEALGFEQIGFLVWRKTNGPGLGQYLRYESEVCLFCTRGKAHVPELAGHQVIEAPRTRHSAKPIEQYDLMEQVSPGPRLEMFARRTQPGWSSWGNEVPESKS